MTIIAKSNMLELFVIATSTYVASVEPRSIATIDTNIGNAHPQPTIMPVKIELSMDNGDPTNDIFLPLLDSMNMLIVNNIDELNAITYTRYSEYIDVNSNIP